MKQFNRPKRLLLSYILLFFAFVSSNAQDFEGVWYPSSDEGMIGNIKIKKEGDEYVVQYKTTVGLKTSKGNDIDGALYFSFLAAKTYGQYWLGKWNGDQFCILVGKGNGHYSSNGHADAIFDPSYDSPQKCANVEYDYREFKLVPEGDNLALYHRCSLYYKAQTSNGERIVLGQSSNFVKANTYTNW